VLYGELKCHNFFSKYPPFSLIQMWIRMSHPRHSVFVTLSRVSGVVIELNQVYERKFV